jgi:hypothetical protein
MALNSFRLPLAVSLISLLACTGSSAKLEIAGLTCGTSVEEIKLQYPNSAPRHYRMPDGTNVVLARLVLPPFELIDVSATPERGVHGIAAHLVNTGEQWATSRENLIAKYGKPSSERKSSDASGDANFVIWGKCTADASPSPRLVGSGCCLSAWSFESSTFLTMQQASR